MQLSNKKERAQESPSRKLVRKRLIAECFAEKWKLMIGSFAMIASSYCNQAVPRVMGRLIDQSKTSSMEKGGASKHSMVYNAVWVALVGGMASFLRTSLLSQAQDSIAARLRRQAWAALLSHKDLEWFQSQSVDQVFDVSESPERDSPSVPTKGMTPSAINLILSDDVDVVAKTASNSLVNVIRSMSSCVFGTYNMLRINPSLLGLSVLVAPAVGMIALVSRKFLKKVLAKQEEAKLKAVSFLEEKLEHILMVKVSNRERDEIDAFSDIQDQCVSLGKQSSFANGLSMGTMFSLGSVALFGILYSGGRAVESGKMKHGDLVSFSTYSFLLALGTAGIFRAMSEFSQGIDSALRVYRLIDSSSNNASQSKDSSSSKDIGLAESLEMIDLSFAYKTNPGKTVLQNVSLKVSCGEVVALIGENGSGKSTISNLFTGLYHPTSGRILANGPNGSTSLGEIHRRDLSQVVQVVPQDSAIFNTSILENVRYSDPTKSREDVLNALNLAGCQSLLSDREQGVDYQVGRNGSRLSGGQKQRLALARALLSKPRILVMDEPTSALDSEGESAFADVVGVCRKHNIGMLVVTHSSKSLTLVDRIIVLEKGTVRETGTLEELRSRPASYLHSVLPSTPDQTNGFK